MQIKTLSTDKPRRRRSSLETTGSSKERLYVQHDYTDHYSDPVYQDEEMLDPEAPRRGPRGGVVTPFPDRLHHMLSEAEKCGFEDIVSWQPHGRCFIVHKPKQFVQEVMPKYFKQSKLTSFQRQVNLYGFRRITAGTDRGGYYNELFLRGRPDLLKLLMRIRVKGTGCKAAASPDTEPNFYSMPPCIEKEESADSAGTSSPKSHSQLDYQKGLNDSSPSKGLNVLLTMESRNESNNHSSRCQERPEQRQDELWFNKMINNDEKLSLLRNSIQESRTAADFEAGSHFQPIQRNYGEQQGYFAAGRLDWVNGAVSPLKPPTALPETRSAWIQSRNRSAFQQQQHHHDNYNYFEHQRQEEEELGLVSTPDTFTPTTCFSQEYFKDHIETELQEPMQHIQGYERSIGDDDLDFALDCFNDPLLFLDD